MIILFLSLSRLIRNEKISKTLFYYVKILLHLMLFEETNELWSVRSELMRIIEMFF